MSQANGDVTTPATAETRATADEESALARIGPADLLDALSRVRHGRVYDLGTEYHWDMPMGPRIAFGSISVTPYRTPQCLLDRENPPGFDFSMDLITGSPHLGTHIDAFAHIQSKGKVHGGQDAADVYGDFGWLANGIETVRPIIGRGILLDVASSLAQEPLPDLFEVRPEHLERCLRAADLTVRQGDTVLVRTGKFASSYKGAGEDYFRSQPGVGVDAAVWLYEQGMAVLGTDTTNTEPFPFPDVDRTVHRAMLIERGVHLLEIIDLEELARERVYQFLFICVPLKFRGATGSWVRPLAVV